MQGYRLQNKNKKCIHAAKELQHVIENSEPSQ
jgi:hypothetical protein